MGIHPKIMAIDLVRLAKDLGIYPGKHSWPQYEPLLARFASRMLEEAARKCDKLAQQYNVARVPSPGAVRVAEECAVSIRRKAIETFR